MSHQSDNGVSSEPGAVGASGHAVEAADWETRASETPSSRTPASLTPASFTPASSTPVSSTPASQSPVSQVPNSQVPGTAAPSESGLRGDAASGTIPSSNIDAIRDLLRKLEEAAEETAVSVGALGSAAAAAAGATATGASSSGTNSASRTADTALATLKPRGAPVSIQRASETKEVFEVPAASRLELDLRPATAIQLSPPERKRSRGAVWSIGIASFVLGVGAAAGVLVTLDPFRAFKPVTTVAQAPVTPVPAAASVVQPAEVSSGSASVSPRDSAVQSAAPSPVVAQTVRDQDIEPRRGPEQVAGERSSTAATGGTIQAAATAPDQRSAEAARVAEAAASIAARPLDTSRLAGFAVVAAERVDLRAGESQTLDLRVDPMPREADPVLVVLRGVPAWLTITKGSTIAEGIWLLPGHHAGDLALVAAEGAEGTAEIKVQIAHVDGRMLAETITRVRVLRPMRPSPLVAAVPEAGEQSLLRMLARGELLLDTGEVEAARLLLRTAAEGGSVAAALKLAQSYDPAEMQRLGMAETSADPALAVRWYERAQTLGSPAAAARLTELSPR